jgi:hypothetical protein
MDTPVLLPSSLTRTRDWNELCSHASPGRGPGISDPPWLSVPRRRRAGFPSGTR